MKHYTFDNAAVSLRGLSAACEFFEPIFLDRGRELLVVALCDDELRLLGLHCFPGTRDQAHIKMREFFGAALQTGFSGIIAAHNHPSGDARPSKADVILTRRLSLIAEALDFVVLDHLVFGSGSVYSFRHAGLL